MEDGRTSWSWTWIWLVTDFILSWFTDKDRDLVTELYTNIRYKIIGIVMVCHSKL